MNAYFVLAATIAAAGADGRPTGAGAGAGASAAPRATIIKSILQREWNNSNSSYQLSWPGSQLAAVTDSDCQPTFGWGNQKTPFHRVFRCAFKISIKTPEGTPTSFDDVRLFERVGGEWRTFKGPMPPVIAPPRTPGNTSN